METFSSEIGAALESTRMSEEIGRNEMQLELQAIAGATLIGKSLAVPHARLAGLKHLHVSVGITVDDPVHVWVLFVSPAEDSKVHLNFLASLSALFKDGGHIESLIKLKSPKAILDYIRQIEIPIL